MAKTIQVSTSLIGEKHVCAVALQSDGSLWAYTFYQGQPAGGEGWTRLPAIPREDGSDAPTPMA